MKKVLNLIFVFAFLLSLFGCTYVNNNNSNELLVGKNLTILIGSGYLGDATGDDICENCEVNENESNYIVEEKKEERKVFKILNTEIEASYVNTSKQIITKYPISIYNSNTKKQQFIVDAEYDEIIGFALLEYPEGYSERTEEADLSTAKNICIDFLKNDFNLNEYVFTSEERNVTGTNDFEFQFVLKKYIYGIVVHHIRINLDMYGNIYALRMSSTHTADNIIIPNIEDSEYIEGAKKRVEEFYSNKENIKEIKDYEITYKNLAYLEEQDSQAIDYGVNYTIVYSDGTERKTGNQFFYLLSQN